MESLPSPEVLDSYRCALEGIFEAMTSPVMKINIVFSIIIVFLTFWYSYKAVILLIHRNIYSNCSRILLMFNLVNVNVWQVNYLVIRLRDLIQILRYSDDHCEIEFHSSECTIQQIINYFCILLSFFCIFSLTCDRFLAFFLNNFYAKHQKTIPTVMLVIFVLISLMIYLWSFYGVPPAGYVPSCYYPPYLSINKFNFVTELLFYFIFSNFVLSFIILAVNTIRDKKLHHSNFNTSTRYISFENLETTRAIFSISTTQFFFLSVTGLTYIATQYYNDEITDKMFHLIVPFTTVILYGNLSIPVLICYQTKHCIFRRKKTIGSMTSATDTMETRMSGLREMWR